MHHADLIIHNAGQLLTCASGGRPKRGREMSDIGIIQNGAVAIRNGRISAVGSSAEILQRYGRAPSIDANGKVVTPGFVDPHTHIVYAGDRLNEFELKIKGAEYLDILAAGGGIVSTVKHTRSATLGKLIATGSTRLDKMLACGTTTCEVKTGYGLDTETELKMLAAIESMDLTHSIGIVPTFLAAHTVPSEFKDKADEYVSLICDEMLQRAWAWYEQSHFPGMGITLFCDVFTERNAFDVEQSRKIFGTAQSLGFGIKAHVDQFTNLGGSSMAIEIGAISVDHLDVISEEEVGALAASETVGVVIPTENFNAGKIRFSPARRLIDAGCAVAISTDYNPGSAPCPSQPMAMAIAARYQKLQPAETFVAATINAAFAIGEGHRVGSIEENKTADLLIFETTDYREIVYEFGVSPSVTVIKKGEVVYDNKRS
jgi:imidazolonepropionase